MTRRKKPTTSQHSKRRQITDSAGWTHIIKGPPGTIDPTTTASHLHQLGGKAATETKYTLETYLDRFRTHYVPIWKASSCFGNLSRILEREMLPSSAAVARKNDDVVIARCVCLGLGSMTAGSESSSYELAALMSMLEILDQNTQPIQPTTIIFQDPIFTPLDRAILQELGHTVVDTPRAFSEIDGSTFLFAPHLECSHYATALETAAATPPAVCVGSDLQVYVDDGLLSSVAENSKEGSCRIFREFLAKVDSRPMPEFDRTPWCESTRIYWRRTPREEDKSGGERRA